MSVSLEFLSHGAIMWHEGVVTGADMIQANATMNAHHYPAGFRYQLMDLCAVTAFDVTPAQMKILADMDRGLVREANHYACVVAPTDYLYAMSRSWNQQAETDLLITHVVRTPAEAVAWLQSCGFQVSPYMDDK